MSISPDAFGAKTLEKHRQTAWVQQGVGWAQKSKQDALESLGAFEACNALMYVPFNAASDVIRKHLKAYVTGVYRARPSVLNPQKLFLSTISHELEAAIGASKAILHLQVDPEEGIAEPYTQETWGRAVKMLRGLADLFWQGSGEYLPVPSIGAADAGSIDLFWKMDKLSLLINVPADSSKNSTFYGRRLEGSKISGVLDKNDAEPRHLTGWLSGRE